MNLPKTLDVLRLLSSYQVEFIVVGMAAAVLHGARVAIFDLDIVYRRTTENVKRLLQALGTIRATLRDDPRELSPDESQLLGSGYQVLSTSLGDLAVQGTLGDGASYEDLLDMSAPLSLKDGLVARVINLTTLIELNQRTGKPKDLATLAVLQATLAEKEALDEKKGL